MYIYMAKVKVYIYLYICVCVYICKDTHFTPLLAVWLCSTACVKIHTKWAYATLVPAGPRWPVFPTPAVLARSGSRPPCVCMYKPASGVQGQVFPTSQRGFNDKASKPHDSKSGHRHEPWHRCLHSRFTRVQTDREPHTCHEMTKVLVKNLKVLAW